MINILHMPVDSDVFLNQTHTGLHHVTGFLKSLLCNVCVYSVCVCLCLCVRVTHNCNGICSWLAVLLSKFKVYTSVVATTNNSREA